MVINSKNLMANLPPAPLEDWYRHRYFDNQIDISGSGTKESQI